MLNRLLRIGLTGVFAAALVGYGVNAAQADTSTNATRVAADDDDDDDGGDADNAGGMGTDTDVDDDDDDGDGGGNADAGDGDGDGDVGDAEAGSGDAGGGHSFILEKGKIVVAGGLLISLSKDAVFKPFSINPDIWYGAADKLEVGLVHSPQATRGFFAGSGGGLCLAGDTNGCPKVYNNLGLLANYLLGEGQLTFAANGGVLFLSLSDPSAITVKAGITGRYVVSDKLMVWFAPNIFIGLTNREIDAGAVTIPFNKERLNIPVGVSYAVSPKMMVGVQTGISGLLDGFGDTYAVPVSAAVFQHISDKLMVGGVFSFDNLLGKNGGGDARSVQIAAKFNVN